MNSYKGPEKDNKNNNYADVDVDRFDDSVVSEDYQQHNKGRTPMKIEVSNEYKVDHSDSIATAHG